MPFFKSLVGAGGSKGSVVSIWHALRRVLQSPWLMWLTAVFFVFFQFCMQLSAGVMIAQLSQSFQLSSWMAGILASSYYFIYVLAQTPAGVLVDRYGPRRLLGGGGLVCALGCAIFAFSHAVGMALCGRVLMGAGCSFAFVGSLYLVNHWFPAHYFTLMVGVAETLGMIGAFVSNIYLSKVLAYTPWRDVMMVSAGIVFMLGLLCYAIIRDAPDKSDAKEACADDHEGATAGAFYRNVVWVVRHPGLWLNGLYVGLIFSIATVFSSHWALVYLSVAQHADLPLVTFECAFVYVGIAIGGPTMGWLYSRLKRKNLFLSCAALAASLMSMVVVFDANLSVGFGMLLFFLMGVSCGAYVFNYTLANQIVPANVRSTSIGFTNTMCFLPVLVMQPLIGWILHFFSSDARTEGEGMYAIGHFQWALSVIPLGLLLAAIAAWYLPKPDSPGVPALSTTEEMRTVA